MKKHLTYLDRIEIQSGIEKGQNFSQIAQAIEKSRTTIGREVKSNVKYRQSSTNTCIHKTECGFPDSCPVKDCSSKALCSKACRKCQLYCNHYEEQICQKLLKPPYVCNPCMDMKTCHRNKKTYDARYAHRRYRNILSESRTGISLTNEEISILEDTIIEPVKRGVSISVAYEQNKERMPVCIRTIYSYIDRNSLQITNLDLRRKVRRKVTRKKGPALKVDKTCYRNRAYKDYLSYIETNQDVCICQMDTVEGTRGGKVLLTILFTNCGLQLMYLRDRNTAAGVSEMFNYLYNLLGSDNYTRLFPVILTDRGSEFTNPTAIEEPGETQEKLCHVFYCDPQQSNQKSNCERNHELIRYVIPKGTSLDSFIQEDMNKLSDHINSYPRKKWNYKSPTDLFINLYGQEISDLLGIKKIEVRSIILTPNLLKK